MKASPEMQRIIRPAERWPNMQMVQMVYVVSNGRLGVQGVYTSARTALASVPDAQWSDQESGSWWDERPGSHLVMEAHGLYSTSHPDEA